jgi:ribosomal protein S6
MAKSKEQETIVEDEGGAGNEPRVYELGFHLDPDLPVEEMKKAYQAIRDAIAGQGTIVAEVEPEKITLAYTISRQEVAGRRDFSSAYFAWIAYEALPEAHAEVVRAAQASSRVIRFIDLVTTKEAAQHAYEAHELAAQAPVASADAAEVPEEAAA